MCHGMDQFTSPNPPAPRLSILALRGAIGGLFMGLANLVPGISGGTMLVAAGVYERFIDAIAELTTFRFRPASLVTFGSIVTAAALAIVLLAGVVRDLVLDHRWVMYSLFIGLTLGGVPVVWRLIGQATRGTWVGACVGFAAMAALAWVQATQQVAGGESDAGFVMLLIAGVAGASAMILPGVSGGYLLLVLGVYVTILTGIDDLKEAIHTRNFDAAIEVGVHLVLPVGLGVVAGVVGVSNLLRWLLHRFNKPTLGVLLGLLVGAVVGLWPFQETVTPQPGDVIKGRVMTAELIAELKPKDMPTRAYVPGAGLVAASGGLIVGGFAVTWLVARVGREETRAKPQAAAERVDQ